MSQTRRRYLRNAAVALVLLVAAAWVAPFFLSTKRYRPLLKAGLERSLHRKVTFGHIALHIFPHLGFTVDNVVVDEDPAFGLEPFVRVASLDCDLRWRSLWSSHLYFGTLQLADPSINLVRNSAGRWNIENLLLQSGIKMQSAGHALAAPSSSLSVEIEGARLNFKIGENKKPFAIVDTRAHLDFDYGSDRVNFRITGDPVRTDLEFPTPGLVELDGNWAPARARGNTLDATLRMQGALLYDWIPLLTGQNPEVYGVMNSTVHLSGTLRKIEYNGEARLSHLHRWEQLPSSNDLPCELRFRGQFDRNKENLLIRGMDLAFANSQIHLEGSIAKVTSRPDFDLVVAFERSRLQDLLRLGVRVLGNPVAWNLTGRMDGMVSVRGPWKGWSYGGFLNAHRVRFDTPSAAFPVSNVALRITRSGVRLSPASVLLAPGVEVVAAGSFRHISPRPGRQRVVLHPAYDLTLYSHAVSLERLVHFGRALGILGGHSLDAKGIGSFTLHLTGGAWPWTRPSVTAQASVRSARLEVPGLTQPLNVPRAHIQVYGKQIIINPIVAVMGTSVFSGWMMHRQEPHAPWNFSLKADRLSIGQAAQWFNGTGQQNTTSFFDRIAGIASFITGRRPSFHLAGHLDARGRLTTPLLTYRQLSLHDFGASIDIHDRKVRLAKVSFQAGSGNGEGSALVDLTKAPAQISGQASVSGTRIQALGRYLPASLARARGYFSATGSFKAAGLNSPEIARTLRGNATIHLDGVSLGGFNPVRTLARRFGMEPLAAGPQPLLIPSATARLQVQNRQVTLEKFPLDLAGAVFQLQGTYFFDGTTRLLVKADLRGVRQRPLPVEPRKNGSVSRMADIRFAGRLRNLEMVPPNQISQTQP